VAAQYYKVAVTLHNQSWVVVPTEGLAVPNRSFVLSRVKWVIENKIAVTLHDQMNVALNLGI
jgi:hypothetical protein